MASIQKLSPEIIGQIAAGEVVERPASAVKELVENSIDAGATSITVELRDGGIGYLRVTDNGKGIPAEQIRLAFERHATSKLRKAEELFDIHTLGFRGEALASIAAVAKVTCTTRVENATFGTRARVQGGEFVDIQQAASPVGTSIVVEDLFFNTPVRLKFLKKPAMEAAMVSDYMLRLILSHPEIAFRFVSQGKTVYRSIGDGKAESALYSLYGREALMQMKRVHGVSGGVIVDGFVGVEELSRGTRAQQSFFVNGRYFKSALLSRALESGCEGRVMIGRFPMCALFLQLPYQQVDVNVHPNKLEVRFQNEASVAEAVRAAVHEAMQSESLSGRLSGEKPAQPEPISPSEGFRVTELLQEPVGQATPKASEAPVIEEKPEKAEPAPAPKVESVPSDTPLGLQPIRIPAVRSAIPVLRESAAPASVSAVMLKGYQNHASTPIIPPPVPAHTTVEQIPMKPAPQSEKEPEQTSLTEDAPENALRFVGVLFHTYWVFELGDRVLMIDQHAAHERILYDQYMKQFEGKHVSQHLLSPQLVRLTAGEIASVEEHLPLLEDAGFEVALFDEKCVAIHAIPTFFGVNEDPRELFLEALGECQSGKGAPTAERMRMKVATMACKRAIKGGDSLTEVDAKGFLATMLKSDAIPTCPHGRPIVSEMTRYELEKRFKRIQ